MTAPAPTTGAAAARDGSLLEDAVRALTAAARDGGDWAEFVTRALAGAAANVGGIEAALVGRPGSWEADLVRQLLTGAVGDDGRLWEHRTDPLVITLYVDELLDDAGAWTSYEEARRELDRRHDAVPDGTEAYERLVDELAELEDRLEEQRRADWAAFGAALEVAVRDVVARRLPALTVPVEVTVDLETFRAEWDKPWTPAVELERELIGEALGSVPVPGDGRPPLERLATEG